MWRSLAPAVFGLSLMGLAACTVVVQPVPTCNASAASFAIGQTATPQMIELARQASGATIVRTLSPGQPITLEYRPDRLNIEINFLRRIVGLSCG
jgi:hypothetical protein